jgi:hypothetical protein
MTCFASWDVGQVSLHEMLDKSHYVNLVHLSLNPHSSVIPLYQYQSHLFSFITQNTFYCMKHIIAVLYRFCSLQLPQPLLKSYQMEQTSTSQANDVSAIMNTFCHLQNLKVHYNVQKSLPDKSSPRSSTLRPLCLINYHCVWDWLNRVTMAR